MKIGIAQINTRVGDFEANCSKIIKACSELSKAGAELVIFPECTVSGYPMKDLIFYDGFVKKAQEYLNGLVGKLEIPAVLGCPRIAEGAIGYRNSAYLIVGDKLTLLCDKHLLTNYGAGNDARNFDSGKEFGIFELNGKKIGVSICEDIWSLPEIETSARYSSQALPLDFFEREKVDILLNLSASVFSDKNDTIRSKGRLLSKVSEKVEAPLVWCNLVGGNDDIVFAGGSGIFDSRKGEYKSKCLKKFEEDLQVIDIEKISGYDGDSFDFQGDDDYIKAMVLGLGDFVRKCGMKKVLIGLSGGIDSALVAALAVEALGAENVIGVSMPSAISSQHSKDDAKSLADNLGIEYYTVSIADIVSSANGALSEVFMGRKADVTEENIQSRSRGLVVMAMSNKFGALVLTTGNKSECAVGYCTLYGDTCGAYAPICDLYKTAVYRISRLINEKAGREIIPQNTIDKPPSAELRPDQKDEDSLPPYDVLDAILRMHIEEFLSASEIIKAGYSKDVVEDVLGKVARAEYKRSQYPLGTKLTSVAYSADRHTLVAIKRGLQ